MTGRTPEVDENIPVTLRADARRNRDRILEAARDLFADRGYDVPIADIARRAGVGVGTLYRRFPDRDALIHHVSVTTLRRLAEIATSALRAEPDAWSALRRFLLEGAGERIGALQTLDADAHAAVRADPEVTAARQELTAALGRLVAAAQESGSMRQDVSAQDVLLLLVQLTRPLDGLPRDARRDLPDRLLRIAVDGLAGDHPTTRLPSMGS